MFKPALLVAALFVALVWLASCHDDSCDSVQHQAEEQVLRAEARAQLCEGTLRDSQAQIAVLRETIDTCEREKVP